MGSELSSEEWARLHYLRSLKGGDRSEQVFTDIQVLEDRQRQYARQEIRSRIEEPLARLRAKAGDIDSLETYQDDLWLNPMPDEPQLVYAELPNMLTDVANKKVFAGYLCRSFHRTLDEVKSIVRLTRDLHASLSPIDGPQWKMDAEFADAASELLLFEAAVEVATNWLDSLHKDIVSRSMSLHALKDLAR